MKAINKQFFINYGLVFLVMIAAVIIPRIMIAGALPSTDEGFYAYFSQIAHASLSNGHGLPNTGMLMLYPISLSWVFGLPVNHILFLRLVDMLVAFIAGLLLFKIYENECKSTLIAALISFIILFSLNQPIFIQSGFKNSIFAAFIPLFTGLLITQNCRMKSNLKWLLVGGCAGLAILLRETFIPFLIVGFLTVLCSRGWKTAVQFIFGSLCVIIFAIVFDGLLRGSLWELFDSYFNSGILYSTLESQRIRFFITHGKLSIEATWIPLFLSVASSAIIIYTFTVSGSQKQLGKFSFWILVVIAPLIEPISKIGFPYHFSVCLVGFGGLTAYCYGLVVNHNVDHLRRWGSTAMLAICALFLLPKGILLMKNWDSNKINLKEWNHNNWRIDSVNESNYLLAANIINQYSRKNESLAVSGFMHALYPLTGMLPSSYALSNLTEVAIKFKLDQNKVKQALMMCPPDILMTTTRKDWPGGDVIERAVEETELYRPVATISVNEKISYGTFGGNIYKKKITNEDECKLQLN